MATSTSWMDESEYRWMLERSARTIVMRRNLSKLQRFCTWMLCAFVGQRIRISGRVGWGYDGYRYSTLQGLEIPLDRVRFNICCFLMNKSMASSWPIRQLDVNNAFLQGSFTDEVFMEQPPGFEVKTFLLLIMFASCISLFMAFGKPLVLGITSFVPF
ncbi:UNVERIFIED_CONTAM: Retrovirus-related Pol polyprotein from transposon RE2 [Sesamum angustifolium]|uniref:Retrovirus-related Pol polyprotein from transposon RE2 n=1 Tax=Sesamum angustifolium TaxID=2727405 RepID=A0AAW2K721_9LAMI